MTTNYVLIDFENVQPKNLEILAAHPFNVIVFCGANQAKVPFDIASALQDMGGNGRYIKISGNGPNALDFHIAYYVGELFCQDPKAEIHIISKDTGFDPLIKHLREKKRRIQRYGDLAEIPILRIASSASIDEQIDAIIKNLVGRGQSRPRKVKTLANTINTLFSKKMEEAELLELIEELKQRKYVVVSDSNVSYKLPTSIN